MAVAFLGLGRMGVLMAGHVLSAGHDLVLWNRTPTACARSSRRSSSPPAR